MHIEFDATNAAFEDRGEYLRILSKIMAAIEMGEDDGVIFDVNGNRVGQWSLFSHDYDEE